MRCLILFALWALLTRTTLIGFISIPESRLANLPRTDPAYALTAARIGAIFEEHCDITLRQTISVAYRIVEGVKYNIVFDTIYGPLNAIAVTKFWDKSVDVSEMKFLDPGNKTNSDAFAKTTLPATGSSSQAPPAQQLPTFLAQTRDAKAPSSAQATFKFPLVRQKCELMRQQLETLQGDQIDDPQVTTELLQKALTQPTASSTPKDPTTTTPSPSKTTAAPSTTTIPGSSNSTPGTGSTSSSSSPSNPLNPLIVSTTSTLSTAKTSTTTTPSTASPSPTSLTTSAPAAGSTPTPSAASTTGTTSTPSTTSSSTTGTTSTTGASSTPTSTSNSNKSTASSTPSPNQTPAAPAPAPASSANDPFSSFGSSWPLPSSLSADPFAWTFRSRFLLRTLE